MSGRYTIIIEAALPARVDLAALRRIATKTLRIERVEPPAQIVVALIDDDAIRALNRRYRGVNRPTDVLSFAAGDTMPGDSPRRHIADIAISLETARRQARQYRVRLQHEVSHLLVHGILHALGYDHEAPADEAVMRRREEQVLRSACHHH